MDGCWAVGRCSCRVERVEGSAAALLCVWLPVNVWLWHPGSGWPRSAGSGVAHTIPIPRARSPGLMPSAVANEHDGLKSPPQQDDKKETATRATNHKRLLAATSKATKTHTVSEKHVPHVNSRHGHPTDNSWGHRLQPSSFLQAVVDISHNALLLCVHVSRRRAFGSANGP